METIFLVATDGTSSADGALRIALELARRGRGSVELLSVVEPTAAVPIPGIPALAPVSIAEDARQVELRRELVSAQIAGLGELAASWPLALELGATSTTIARVAEERGAALIIVGLQPHGRMERLLRSETALAVVHSTYLPVLAVPWTVTGLPRQVLVALDFQGPTTDAVASTLPLLGESARVHLAHVSWEVGLDGDVVDALRRETYRYGAAARLEEVAARLWLETNFPIETHVEIGDPEEELLALGERIHADMIVAGTHGFGMLRRALIRSVSTGLIRHAPCSVLLTPVPDDHRPGRHALDEPAEHPELPASHVAWAV